MDVQGDHASGRLTDVLGVGGILQGEQADVTHTRLLVEVEGPEGNSEQIIVARAPHQLGHLQGALRLEAESPEWQETSLRHPELVSGILIEPEVPRDIIKGVEVNHSLHHFGGYQELLIHVLLRRSPRRDISFSVKFILLFFVGLSFPQTKVIEYDERTHGV